MVPYFRTGDRSAFTLIELLVVIGVIAILSVVVILTLNPAELLRQSRDSNRVSDMTTLTNALALYSEDVGGSLGSANTVYVSIADPTATSTAGDQCQGIGLPSLPATYFYHCAASSTFRGVNGNGWIPLNFTQISSGAPMGALPVDPVNQSSSRLYYTYDTNGTNYEVTAVMESQKYQLAGTNDAIGPDGGTLASVYEKGSKLGLEPLDYGDNSLVAYWTMDEGTGTVAYDYSGANATGSWGGTQAGTSGYYSAGKVGPWGGTFNGTNDVVNTPALNIFNEHAFTVSAWVYPTVSKEDEGIFGACLSQTMDECLHLAIRTGNPYMGFFGDDISGGTSTLNAWEYLAFTYTGGAGGTRSIYLNGSVVASGTSAVGLQVPNGITSTIGLDIEANLQGSIDDVRVYNRALSAAQITAMYNGGK